MRILLVDNYDSFTHNLAHAIRIQGAQVAVRRNDAITPQEIEDMAPDAIVLSPGPGHPAQPRDFGVCTDIIRHQTHTPLLGVCLGMQGMAHHTGTPVGPAPRIVHGEATRFRRGDHPVFADLPRTPKVGRYHSLVVQGDLGPQWEDLGRTSGGALMAMAHRRRPWIGLQFHPESILTPDGPKMITNFLRYAMEART